MKGWRNKWGIWRKVNWIKTVYFNFKMLPFSVALKLPVWFYGRVKFSNLSGRIILQGSVRRGMVGFGQPYESITRSKGTAELFLAGDLVVSGHVQFGKDYFVYVAPNAKLTMGHMSSLGGNGKIFCYEKVSFGQYARLGFESQVMDSNFHEMIDTESGQAFAMIQAISIGNYNYFGHRISVMPGTQTGDYCTVASMSLVNADYTDLGPHVLVGGIPAKLIRRNITRNWEKEKPMLEEWLVID